MDLPGLLATLPTEQRLALAYSGSAQRPLFLGLLALDTRLASIVRRSAEPLLGQIQLAWWREQLALEPARRAQGEPLLALLGGWGAAGSELTALVDGWEGLVGEAVVGRSAFALHADARARAFVALARLAGSESDEIWRAARNWGIADLASRLDEAAQRFAAIELSGALDWKPARLPRAMRPLAVLHGLARRRRGQAALLDGPLAFGAAIRLGLTGR